MHGKWFRGEISFQCTNARWNRKWSTHSFVCVRAISYRKVRNAQQRRLFFSCRVTGSQKPIQWHDECFDVCVCVQWANRWLLSLEWCMCSNVWSKKRMGSCSWINIICLCLLVFGWYMCCGCLSCFYCNWMGPGSSRSLHRVHIKMRNWEMIQYEYVCLFGMNVCVCVCLCTLQGTSSPTWSAQRWLYFYQMQQTTHPCHALSQLASHLHCKSNFIFAVQFQSCYCNSIIYSFSSFFSFPFAVGCWPVVV